MSTMVAPSTIDVIDGTLTVLSKGRNFIAYKDLASLVAAVAERDSSLASSATAALEVRDGDQVVPLSVAIDLFLDMRNASS